MNPCKRFKDLIFHFIDDELGSYQKKELHEHLSMCKGCDQFLKSLQQCRSHLKSLTPIQCSENFQILMRERIRREVARKGLSRSPFYSARFRWAAVAGLAVVLIVTGIWVGDPRKSQDGIMSQVEDRNAQGSVEKISFSSQPRYVAGYNPNRISVSREDMPDSLSASRDSLLVENQTENPQLNVTPVSF